MKLKEAVYENCGECGRHKRTVQEEEYGCDECKRAIADIYRLTDAGGRQFLDVSVFYKEGEVKHLQFCSWKCVFRHLPKIKTDYFVSLPYASYDGSVPKGQTANDFLSLVRKAIRK